MNALRSAKVIILPSYNMLKLGIAKRGKGKKNLPGDEIECTGV
jgi:hypothetical protein